LCCKQIIITGGLLFLMFSISLGQNLEFVSSFTINSLNDVYINNNQAYLATSDGLHIIDINDLSNPFQMGSLQIPNNVRGLVVSGNYAYLSVWFTGLYIVDITDPYTPSFVANYSMTWYTGDIGLVGAYIYICDYLGNYEIVNISNPQDPIHAGYYETGDAADIEFEGVYAYIADGNYGLRIINISDPANPTFVGGNPDLWIAVSVDIAGVYAYLAALDAGIRVVDINDRSNPQQISLFTPQSRAIDIAIMGNNALLAEEATGLELINISNPDSISHIETYNTPGNALNIATQGEYAFVADRSSLQIFHVRSTAIDDDREIALPEQANMSCYPNPFNSRINIVVTLPKEGQSQLGIYDIMGREITIFPNQLMHIGSNIITWDGYNYEGGLEPSGIYFVRLNFSNYEVKSKIILLK